jgi:aspartate aminotransferase
MGTFHGQCIQKIHHNKSLQLLIKKRDLLGLFFLFFTYENKSKYFRIKTFCNFLINEKVKELRIMGQEVTHFGFGQSPFPIHNAIVEELKNNASNNHYLPVNGLQELRQQVVQFSFKHQGIQRASDLIFIGPGSKELLYQSVLIFEGHFIIPKGSWVSYIPQIKSKGGTYSVLETTLEDNFKLTPNCLRGIFKRKSSKTYPCFKLSK